MRIRGVERRSQLLPCLAAADGFLLTDERGMEIVKHRIAVIGRNWNVVCDDARLMNDADRRLLWRWQFLNDLAFEGLEGRLDDVIGDLFHGQARVCILHLHGYHMRGFGCSIASDRFSFPSHGLGRPSPEIRRAAAAGRRAKEGSAPGHGATEQRSNARRRSRSLAQRPGNRRAMNATNRRNA